MAEIVGLALAAPGVIDVIMRGAAAVYEKIDTFRHMDSTMASFRDLSLNIKEGTLFFALTNVKAACSDRMIPAKILAQLDAALECVKQALGNTEKGLSCVGNGHLGRLKYALWQGEGSKNRLDKHFEELKESCDRLKDLCLQLHQYRSAPSCFLLTSDSFKIRHETPDNRPGSALPDSDILIARGNYVFRDKRVECDFVLEDKTQENDVQFLSSKLNADSLSELNGSILPVLGYRQPPYNQSDGTKIFQVVVKVPPSLNRSSLSHRLETKPCPDLRGRLELCRSIAHATKVVHGIGLVHKALRPRAILMLWEAGAPPSTAKAYLQDWTYARGVSGATAELGEAVWPKRIYQHPERQGEYAEAKYETRHDTYCLGVCILEILLWRPFVVDAPTGTQGSQLNICDLFPQYAFRRKEQNGGLPERYRGDLAKITSRPWITKRIWEDIADAELSNPDSTKLVRQCLDGVFKAAEDVEVRLGELIATAPP